MLNSGDPALGRRKVDGLFDQVLVLELLGAGAVVDHTAQKRVGVDVKHAALDGNVFALHLHIRRGTKRFAGVVDHLKRDVNVVATAGERERLDRTYPVGIAPGERHAQRVLTVGHFVHRFL